MHCIELTSQLDNVEKWRRETLSIEQQKPLVLILTKSDLRRFSPEVIDDEMIEEKKKSLSMQMHTETSSKNYSIMNV